MTLYDCMLLLKPHVEKVSHIELVGRVGKHVYCRNGVLIDIKSFGKIYLGYGIKKLDGKYYEDQLTQIVIMVTTPNFNKEVHYPDKEDRLLCWLLVKHWSTKYGLEFVACDDGKVDLSKLSRSSFYDTEEDKEDDDDDDYDEEYEAEDTKK